MKQAFAIYFLILLISQTQAEFCYKKINDISISEIQRNKRIYNECLNSKLEELRSYSEDGKFYPDAQKQNEVKIECFYVIKNPSEKYKSYFQCLKNHHEAKFDVSIKITNLKDEKKGTDIEYWNDYYEEKMFEYGIKGKN